MGNNTNMQPAALGGGANQMGQTEDGADLARCVDSIFTFRKEIIQKQYEKVRFRKEIINRKKTLSRRRRTFTLGSTPQSRILDFPVPLVRDIFREIIPATLFPKFR